MAVVIGIQTSRVICLYDRGDTCLQCFAVRVVEPALLVARVLIEGRWWCFGGWQGLLFLAHGADADYKYCTVLSLAVLGSGATGLWQPNVPISPENSKVSACFRDNKYDGT